MAMNQESTFRIVLGLGFFAVLALTLRYRIRSWASKEKLDRRQEGLFILATLRPVALLVWLGAIAYLVNPAWMAWSSVPLPAWVRWTGVIVCALGIGLLAWTLRGLGTNLTDTVVTRRAHTLVTHGPYRWVRHPFYDATALLILSIALIAANWFVLLAGVIAFALLALRARTEEARLLARFGEPYRAYKQRTGRFVPKLRGKHARGRVRLGGMNAEFSNVYDDKARARAYAKLEFPGTYFLAYRDLPAIVGEHARGRRALDFGCGAGRSTRFLRALGFDVVGVDIAEHMLAQAHELDPQGDYRQVPDTGPGGLAPAIFDLVLSAFTFDNVPSMEKKVALFQALKGLLARDGRIVNLVSSPQIYVNEWASFSTRDFPENRLANSGDPVRIVMLDVDDRRPVEDIVWTDEDYREVYRRAGLAPIATYRPLAKPSEPYAWVSEVTIAPWVIYVLGHAETRNVG